MRMGTVFVFVIIALGLGTSPALAQVINETFKVSGHLGIAASAGPCNSLAYSTCPSGHTCICYTATKTSLHTGSGGLLTIPPGTTQVAVSVDATDKTSAPGCKPARGEVQYTETGGGPDTATVEFFAAICPPLAAGLPKTFSGGGALTNATLEVEGIPFAGITGLGTATGTFFAGAAGQNLTLNFTAVVSP
jgi:hypothetical protein